MLENFFLWRLLFFRADARKEYLACHEYTNKYCESITFCFCSLLIADSKIPHRRECKTIMGTRARNWFCDECAKTFFCGDYSFSVRMGERNIWFATNTRLSIAKALLLFLFTLIVDSKIAHRRACKTIMGTRARNWFCDECGKTFFCGDYSFSVRMRERNIWFATNTQISIAKALLFLSVHN